MAHDAFQLVSRNGITWLESAALARFTWLVHGFSTRLAEDSRGRSGADFNLGRSAGAPDRQVLRNRRRFAEALGNGFSLAALRQIHSATVYEVVIAGSGATRRALGRAALEYRAAGCLPARHASQAEAGPARAAVADPLSLPAGDALLTAQPGVLLSVRTADCLPVLLVDPRRRWVAAIHAGWRGALERVIEKAVGELRRLYGSDPAHLVAALGPGIGACCYEVGDEVVEAFQGQFVPSAGFFKTPPADEPAGRLDLRYQLLFHTQAPPGHRRERARLHLDLTAVARAQLLAAGLKPGRIHAAGCCTSCRADLFFSHRREGARAGRMMAAIGLRP
ncbi:MAG TPA: peptidoglycan editing factor PgeF [Terriglobia bacterium]|nr:peptidoglycan editing factor PgeF [Terriglobia bacterium]